MAKTFTFPVAFVLTVLIASGSALAQQKRDDMKSMDMGNKSGASSATSHHAAGVVKKVDPKAGTVTMDHGPVKSLNWPAMTMTFGLSDKALIDKLKPGAKVEFEFVQQGRKSVITSLH